MMRSWALLTALILGASCLLAAEKPIPVVLDTDIGDDIDDALALALALQSPELEVRAVNTVLQHRERRADLIWKILQLYDRTDIPVGMGAEQPLLTPPRTGIVNQTRALAPDERMPEDRRRNGISLLIDTCMNAPDKVSVVAYGPLTNVALALKTEPRIAAKIERLVLMNGVFLRPQVEYNTTRDPEAASIVFGSGIPITVVGLDVTTQCRLDSGHLRQIAESSLPNVKFIHQLIRLWQGPREDQRPVLHDPLSVAVTFRPGLIRTRLGRVDVETRGEPNRTYGMTLLRPDAAGTTRVATEVDSQEFVRLFVDRLLRAPRTR